MNDCILMQMKIELKSVNSRPPKTILDHKITLAKKKDGPLVPDRGLQSGVAIMDRLAETLAIFFHECNQFSCIGFAPNKIGFLDRLILIVEGHRVVGTGSSKVSAPRRHPVVAIGPGIHQQGRALF
jgi:hypothetical protein